MSVVEADGAHAGSSPKTIATAIIAEKIAGARSCTVGCPIVASFFAPHSFGKNAEAPFPSSDSESWPPLIRTPLREAIAHRSTARESLQLQYSVAHTIVYNDLAGKRRAAQRTAKPAAVCRASPDAALARYTPANAWSMSAIRSAASSRPQLKRTMSGVMPQATNSSSVSWRCVLLAGCRQHVRASAT